MTLKSDAKFEEKMILGSKNDMKNSANFHQVHFNELLLTKVYNVSAKILQRSYVS